MENKLKINDLGFKKTEKVIDLLNNKDRNATLRENKSYSNVDVFNRWKKSRENNLYGNLILSGLPLGINDADLTNIDFSNTRFDAVYFTNTNLENSNFQGADSDNLMLVRCNLKNANFRNIHNLYKLGSYESNFENVDFRGTKLFNDSYNWNINNFYSQNRFKNVKVDSSQMDLLENKLSINRNRKLKDSFSVVPYGFKSPQFKYISCNLCNNRKI